MNEQDYTALHDQVARQTPELAALDAQIATAQPDVDALQATADVAQAAFDDADEEGKPAAKDALDAALQALAGPKADLGALTGAADPIRAAIAQCQAEMDGSGLTVDTNAVKLAEVKAAMWERIKAERERRQMEGGVLVGGKWFLSNDREAGRYGLIITAAQKAGAPGSYVMRAAWRTMEDGVTQDMTADLAGQIIVAGLAQFAAIDDAAQAHRAAMEASADPAAYSFASGWPAIYGG